MAKGINQTAITITPKLILRLHGCRTSSCYSFVKDIIAMVNTKMKDASRATQAEWIRFFPLQPQVRGGPSPHTHTHKPLAIQENRPQRRKEIQKSSSPNALCGHQHQPFPYVALILSALQTPPNTRVTKNSTARKQTNL